MRTLSILTILILLPMMAEAQARSQTSGLMLNAHLNGSAISPDDSDDMESGAGLGLTVGWGFSPRWMLYAAGDGAAISATGLGGDYTLGHFDLGVRYSFADPESAWIPFASAAVSGRSAIWSDFTAGEDLTVSGAGLSVGGGISHFFNPSLALETSLRWSFGEFSEVSLGDASGGLDEYAFGATSARFDLGLSWYARGR